MQKHVAIKDGYSEQQLYRQRLYLSLGIVVVLLSVLIYRYADLQLVQYDTFVTQSERNRVHVQPVAPKRGLIFDRKGRLLADNRPSYSLVIVKERVDNLDDTLTDLQQLFDIDKNNIEKFKRRLRRRSPYQSVPLKFRLSEDEISRFAVNRYRLPGVEIKAQLVRHYPEGAAFTHIVGYVGRISSSDQERLDSAEGNQTNYAATDHIGKIGLERYYETILHGVVGSQHVETNAHGRVLRVLQQVDPEPGIDITLYADVELQKTISKIMAGRRGSVVALDPRTGGILAMVSTPSYDPNPFVTGIGSHDYSKLRDSINLPLFNRSLQGQYPPGSTIKPIMGLAGLHYRIVSRSSSVADPGWYQLANDERFYRDWKRGGHAPFMNLHSSMAQSCDVYFYDLAYKLGVDRIFEFSSEFGLGQLTGIDSTSERRGLLPSREWKRKQKREPWFPGETLNIGIGQGYMLVTPLQLAVATATIANRGERPVPRLAMPTKGLRDALFEKNSLFQSESSKTLQNMPALTPLNDLPVVDNHWSQIIAGMEAVMHGARGTARAAGAGAKYRIAGKTGTAQVIGIAQGEKYDKEAIIERQRDHALFIGFAPIDNPLVAVAIIIENGGSGSSVAAPIGRKIFDWVIEHEEDLKSEPIPAESLPSFNNTDLAPIAFINKRELLNASAI